MLNEYGKAARKARIDAGVSMLKMAEAIGVAPSFLSQMETGKRTISSTFVQKAEEFFRNLGLNVSLREAADLSNNAVSLDGVEPELKGLVAGFARAELSEEDIRRLNEILTNAKKRGL